MALLAVTGCATTPPETKRESEMAAIQQAVVVIEKRSGGRLGVAMTDAEGALIFGHRADERFAMCSTFKLLLAGQVLEGATKGGSSLRTPLPFTKADLVAYSPGTEKLLAQGEQRLGFAAEDAVVLSDNSAANLILKHIGGPQAFTAGMRRIGDAVTRLDRMEPELNENIPGDPRDTSSPAAFAKSAAAYVFGDRLSASHRKWLRDWLVKSETGLKRIRTGLPKDWLVGDKTGSCGTAYNDVAFVEEADGDRRIIAVYLDRPKVTGDAASAAIADVARAVARDLP